MHDPQRGANESATTTKKTRRSDLREEMNQSFQKEMLKIPTYHSISNDHLIKFKVFEMMQSKNGGQIEINKSLIKRIQSISNQQTYFSMQGSSHQSQSTLCFYKMLKCESKLIKFILELNGLMNTDRHDWNMLWTHTQGKT